MPEIKAVSYSHDGIIDIIITNPFVHGKELAAMTGYSETWLSIIRNSDSFKERLAERKAEIVDPYLTASIEAKLDAVAHRSLERLMEKLDSPIGMKTLELVAVAKLGVGDRANRPAAPTQNLYVVHLPAPAQDSSSWLNNTQGNKPQARPLEIIEEIPRSEK